MPGRAQDPLFNPLNGNLSERNEIVLALDFGKFRIQSNIHAKSGQRFEIAAELLRRGVEDAVRSLGIIETIAEGSIRSRERPIGRFPGIWAASNSENRTVGFDAEGDD